MPDRGDHDGAIWVILMGVTAILEVDQVEIVATGPLATCALRNDKSVWCWGARFGWHTSNPIERALRPTKVDGLPPVASIALGADHACAVTTAGEVWCWGSNIEREVGVDIDEPNLPPTRVQGICDAVQVAAGFNHSCAVERSGALVCWGDNSLGQQGDGTTRPPRHPPRL